MRGTPEGLCRRIQQLLRRGSLHWAVENDGEAATESVFATTLLLDGTVRGVWSTEAGLKPDKWQGVKGIPIGKLSAGEHTFRMVVDVGEYVTESDEDDNEFSKTITVTQPSANLQPYQPSGWPSRIIVTTSPAGGEDLSVITTQDDLYVRSAVENSGDSPTEAVFATAMFVDGIGQGFQSMERGLQPGAWIEVENLPIGKLSEGEHTLKIVADFGKV